MNRDNQQMMITALAMTAPLAHYAGVGYMAVLLAAGAMIPLVFLSGDGLKRVSKGEAALELLWIGIILGSIMPVAGENWPGSKSKIVVPLVILVLAVISGERSVSQRTCATLYWIGLVPIILTGTVLIGQIEPTWLKPEPREWTPGLLVILLYPALNGTRKRFNGKTGLALVLMAGLLSSVIQGGLGINHAVKEESPLYELGRCVGNGGFEIIIAVILTLSWYGFAALGMQAAESFGEKLGISKFNSRLGIAVIAATVTLASIKIAGIILIAGSLILWILLPIIPGKNKSKKDEKRC